MIAFELPWPPSVNTLYNSVNMGGKIRRVPGKKLVHYKKTVCLELQRQFGYSTPRVSGKCTLQLFLIQPDRRRRDASNHIKALEDGLTEAGIWSDDCMVQRVTAEFAIDEFGEYVTTKGGVVQVTITALEFETREPDLFPAEPQAVEEGVPF